MTAPQLHFTDDAWGIFEALPERAQRECAAMCDAVLNNPTPNGAEKWTGGVPDTYVWHGQTVSVWYRLISPAEIDVVYLRANT